MSERRRMLALALCLVVLMTAAASAVLVAHELTHGHDCRGEGCPVCALIAGIHRLRRALGAALGVLLAALSCAALRVAEGVGVALPALAMPVRLRTRLND